MATPKLIFGAGALNKDNGFHSAEDVKPWLEALLESKAQGLVDKIDTAAAYRESQDYLAELDFVSHFSIDSKVTGGANPEQPATGDVVMAEAKENLRKLGMDKVRVSQIRSFFFFFLFFFPFSPGFFCLPRWIPW